MHKLISLRITVLIDFLMKIVTHKGRNCDSYFNISFDGVLHLKQGSKAMTYSNGLFDCQSPSSPVLGSLRAVHLLEDLRGVLELMDTDERENLRSQVPDNTAESLVEWLHARLVSRRRVTSSKQIIDYKY